MAPGTPSRRLWIAALAVSAVCLAGLGYGLVTEWDTEPVRPSGPQPAQVQQRASQSRGGFTLGLVLGIGGGIVIGSLIALRRPRG